MEWYFEKALLTNIRCPSNTTRKVLLTLYCRVKGLGRVLYQNEAIMPTAKAFIH
jgi:hypothetical protein